VFDKVVVAVLQNSSKQPEFTTEERMEMLRRVTSHLPNVEVNCFNGLLIDFVHAIGANIIIKGLRAVSDFEYEFQMALVNVKLAPEVETLFMMTADKYSFLSSSIVRELAKFGGKLTELVPEEIIEDIYNKLKENGG